MDEKEHSKNWRQLENLSFSPKRTTLSIFFEENGEEHFAIVPLPTVTAAVTKA